MPLIKDKDRYKKLSSRDRGRARLSESSNLPNKSINISKRNNQELTEKRKTEDNLEASVNNSNLTSVQSIHVASTTVTNIFKLSKGQTLKKFLIVNDANATQYFDLHWSFKQKSDLTLTTAGTGSEIIISEANNESTRLFRRALGTYGSFAGVNDLSTSNKQNQSFDIEDLFNNVSKDIYFYFVSTQDTHITYLIK